MRHLWCGVAAIAVLSFAATAWAQAPLSPSGAVNNPQSHAIAFPNASPTPPPVPPAAVPKTPVAEPSPPAPIPGPSQSAGKATVAPPGAASEETTTRTTAASSEGERKTAVSRPKRPARSAGREAPQRSSSERGERYPGDDVANMLNARELGRVEGGGGPGPMLPPTGPPPGYPRPPAYGPPPGYGPGFGSPPAYGAYPPPAAMVRAPY
jgi:hypothetical protein